MCHRVNGTLKKKTFEREEISSLYHLFVFTKLLNLTNVLISPYSLESLLILGKNSSKIKNCRNNLTKSLLIISILTSIILKIS